MANLATRHCTPVKKGTRPISVEVARSLLNTLRSGWALDSKVQSIYRIFEFKDFHEATGFVNAIAWIANTENHNPHLEITNNRCKVTYSTEAVGGLTVNDFICAAKIDALLKLEKSNKLQNVKQPPAVTQSPSVEPPAPKKEATKKSSNTGDYPAFNAAEAEALLNRDAIEKEIMQDTPEEDEEDEIVLIDPTEGQSTDKLPAGTPKPAHASEKPPKQITEKQPVADKHHDENTDSIEDALMSTMILPPGMEIDEHNPPPKKDSANIDVMSTLIIPPEADIDDTSNNRHEESTIILPPPEKTDQNDNIQSHKPAAPADPKEIKTMVLDSPPDMGQHKNNSNEPDPDEVRTMAISSVNLAGLEEDKTEAADQAIEEDETLILDVNTLKPVNRE